MAKLARLNPFLLLAWALILAAGAAMAYGHTVWGSVALLFSAGFVRRARTNAVAGLATQDDQLPRPSRRLWIAAGVLALMAGLSFYFLYEDARHGYQQAWPVYLFAAIALASAGVVGAVVARILQ